MLATLSAAPFSRQGWLFEPKLDGERCLVFRRGEALELFSRNRKPLTARYPELIEPLRRQKPHRFILDGEIVTFHGKVTSFARLQQRMQVADPSPALQKRVPVWFFAFDLLYLDTYDLRPLPLRQRRQFLESAFEFRAPLCVTECRATAGEAYFRTACRRHWEGIVGKDAAGPYVSRRSRQWLKFKCGREQEFVIAGYTDPQGKRAGFGALLAGYYDRGRLRYAGKIGSGYDDATLRKLAARLARLAIPASPFAGEDLPGSGVHWVRPELVAQIGFTEWTGGGKLRHPRFLGLRDDKEPRAVRREDGR